MSKAILRKLDAYQAANLEAAQIIAADPDRYPVGSLLHTWAQIILEASPEAGRVRNGRPIFVKTAHRGMRRLRDPENDITTVTGEDGRPVGIKDEPAILRQPGLVFGEATCGATGTLSQQGAEDKAKAADCFGSGGRPLVPAGLRNRGDVPILSNVGSDREEKQTAADSCPETAALPAVCAQQAVRECGQRYQGASRVATRRGS